MTTGFDWAGAVGDVWAAEWRRTDRSFAQLSAHLDAAILAAAPDGAFKAFDIGCGAGGTSLALAAARPDATIVGVDLSAGLIEVARERCLDLAPLSRGRQSMAAGDVLGDPGPAPARQRDGREADVSFDVGDAVAAAREHAPLDLLYSRHGVMFFDDPVAAFAALRAAAAPGAALVFSCFAPWADNGFAGALAQAVGAPPPTPRAPGPFAFADPDHVAAILAASGWRDAAPQLAPFAYRAGEGDDPVADALSFFQRIGPAAPVLRAASPDNRQRLVDRIEAVIADHRVGNAIDFPAQAWIWSARAADGPAVGERA